MTKDNPINNIHDLLKAMLEGVNPIYVTSNYYMKKIKNPSKKQYGTLLAETIQIAYAYGCEFIEVKDDNNAN